MFCRKGNGVCRFFALAIRLARLGGAEVVARVDLLVGARVILEFDGALKYADDPSGLSLFKEKLREDRLRALGFVVVRVSWADLTNPARLLARVYAALAAAERSA